MSRCNIFLGIISALTIFLTFSPASVFADHLDRIETRRTIRHLTERTDDMQDRLEGWMEEHGHHEDRMHKAEELNHRIDDFVTALMSLRLAVVQHQEPWDARDQAKSLIDNARELRRAIEHADYLPSEVTADWKEMHELTNQLAKVYHLEAGR